MKRFENDYVSMWIDDGILFSSYKINLAIDLERAKKIVEDRLSFTEGRSYLILIDFSNIKSVSKEARDYMNDPDGGLKGILGGAFLSNNVVGTLFINLYIKINRPSTPTRFFTNKDEALQWLRKIKAGMEAEPVSH